MQIGPRFIAQGFFFDDFFAIFLAEGHSDLREGDGLSYACQGYTQGG
jgi:hypothetical protein